MVLVMYSAAQAEESTATNAAPAAAAVPAAQEEDDKGEGTNAAPASVEADYKPPRDAQLTDREIWNMGYDYWKAGDTTNALVTLQPLLLSRTHGARAAEVVGTLEHAKRRSLQTEDPVGAEKAASGRRPTTRAPTATSRAPPTSSRSCARARMWRRC